MNKTESPLLEAIRRAGSQSELARKIGVRQQNIWDWINKGKRQVPAEYAMAIEEATGVLASDLRPDVFCQARSQSSHSLMQAQAAA